MLHDAMFRSRLLRSALRGNAAFSGLTALALLAAGPSMASYLGAFPPGQLLSLGVQLALFAAWLLWLASRPLVPRWQVWLVIALDALWVVGSLMLLVSPPASLTTGGWWAVAIVMDVIGLFAALQFLGLRRVAVSEPDTGRA